MTVIVDSHQHFWSVGRGDYGWLTPDIEPLYRDFQPSDLMPWLDRTGVSFSVLVQAAPTVEETGYLLDLATEFDFIRGVVGWVDMERGTRAMEDLAKLSAHPRFLGIRPMIQDIPDPAWMLSPGLDDVWRFMVDRDLRFDALVKPPHLPHLLELIRRHPDLRTVIDHGAKPGIADRLWEPWAANIGAIAGGTGTCCKLSGLLTEAAPDQPPAQSRRYFDYLIDQFGADRLMWGSDWPVLNLAADYVTWFELCREWLSALQLEQQQAILGGTAVRFYGLDVS